MKTVILCGGEGTRLRELTEAIPKALVEIGGKPILWHIMRIYSEQGFNKFVLCLGYKGDKIKEYFESGKNENWSIEFVDTGLSTNTGGRLKRIEDYIKDDYFMATYADGLANIDLNLLLKTHNEQAKTATITVVKPTLQFGLVNIDESAAVLGFQEKPKLEEWINGGFFVFTKDIFNYLNEEDILEETPFRKLINDRKLVAYRHEGFWECMDTYKDHVLLNNAWKSNNAPWKIW